MTGRLHFSSTTNEGVVVTCDEVFAVVREEPAGLQEGQGQVAGVQRLVPAGR